jgi:hypothetical protein
LLASGKANSAANLVTTALDAGKVGVSVTAAPPPQGSRTNAKT